MDLTSTAHLSLRTLSRVGAGTDCVFAGTRGGSQEGVPRQGPSRVAERRRLLGSEREGPVKLKCLYTP